MTVTATAYLTQAQAQKKGESSFAAEVNAEKASEADRMATRHSTAVTTAALQPLQPKRLPRAHAMEDMGWSHQKGHVLRLTSPFSLPGSPKGPRCFLNTGELKEGLGGL